MLTKQEINLIIDFTKTSPIWKIFKKLFEEKKIKVLEFMSDLDLDDDKQRQFYKKKQLELKSFQSFIKEIEWLDKEKEILKLVDEYNSEIEKEINWWTKAEEKIDKN